MAISPEAVFLLDTHAFFWAVSAPERLSPAARAEIARPSNRLLVSAASVWEMAIKLRSGNWPAVAPLVSDVEGVTAELDADFLAVSAPHGRRAGLLDWNHRDPFDRMLAAQAVVERCPLVTRDDAFRDVAGLSVWW